MGGPYDYGNARVAALRGRLLGVGSLRRLEGSGSPAAFLALLEQADDWRAIVRDVRPLAADAEAAIEGAIDRHRAARLSGLPAMYQPPTRALVEALVMPLDVERVIAIVRRWRAGQSPEAVASTIVGAALLGPSELGRVARAPSIAAVVRILGQTDLIEPADIAAAAATLAEDVEPAIAERAILEACQLARERRASGRGANARLVRDVLAADRRAALAVRAELDAMGVAEAALLERRRRLAHLDDLARIGHRDPLGIGTVVAYVAAVEAQAIRLRAILAGLSAGWPRERVGAYLVLRASRVAAPAGVF